jgi:2-iminobutanoate/2-iminopropanoate deaminase
VLSRREIGTPRTALPFGAYSQAIEEDGTIHVSTNGSLNPNAETNPEGIEEQPRQAVGNIRTILIESGATLDDVVRVTVRLSDIKNYAVFDKVYRESFHFPFPARTVICSHLVTNLVEIDIVARPNAQDGTRAK